ncbi:MAG TPA: T9SS type A sorting domain-containing protein [Chitinophagaceae bacterium]|nr:T9SS type A sorting domain-containing protein [Chitinophagales bacterium]HPG11828.1 T9SS type A sorting domain-containing protein [Chitinophagaceae bacterium]
MKLKFTILSSLLIFLFLPILTASQITTPVIKANFGIDADLRCNYYNGFVQSGNDDWFKLPGSVGTGQFIIDTTGASAIVAGYVSNPSSRQLPFYRTMRFPPYSTVNNRLLIDAYFVRDYHGDDSTIFASGSNKNGMSPADWSCPVSQSVPDKNEILDMMLHVRRAGPNFTDSMWMIGGISIENTTGNRYFDFEMYQTDIYYDRATRQFYNYGPDAGHTRWQFDGAGSMTAPGDIIFTAEYSSSSLTNVEARIWIDKDDLLITPAEFNWTGSFDGATSGSQYGYAGIQPKAAGAFYTGLQSANNTWAGDFSLVLGDNSVTTTYTARQYMEFSVNLTKLGLDQARIFGGDDCLMPFRRVIVKTRASTSFTAALKDFVAPFDFFLAPAAEIETITPTICDTGSISQIYITNPIPTSIYTWSTLNGNIVGSTTGTSIVVDTPGVYIVSQQLQTGCSVYATDTITIGSLGECNVLANNLVEFNSSMQDRTVSLDWKVLENQLVNYFELERSEDGLQFETIKQIDVHRGFTGEQLYNYTDDLYGYYNKEVYYRLKAVQQDGSVIYSRIKKHSISQHNQIILIPNPAKDNLRLIMNADSPSTAEISIYTQTGILAERRKIYLTTGQNTLDLSGICNKLQSGYHSILIRTDNKVYSEKFLVIK